jgi:hypothetical protein
MNNLAIAATVLVIVGLHIATAATPTPTLTPQTPCMDADTRERTRTIMFAGIEEGLKRHTVSVYDTWLKDPSDQPARASRGLHIGISAYVRSRQSILNWSPPVC